MRGVVTLTDAATGAFGYVPNAGAEGTDTFTFSVSDGTATSDVALVTVGIAPDTTPPTISVIGSATTPEDTSTAALAFTVGDTETPAAQLTLTASSDNPALTPVANIVFGGSGAARTVTISPAPDLSGTANITVTVSDGVNTASRTFALTVTPVADSPVITGPFANQVTKRGVVTTAQTFTIADVDTPVAGLTVTAVSSNTTILPTVTLGGSGATRTITVSDGASAPATSAFTVTVDAPPSIAAVANQVGCSNVAGTAIALTVNDLDSPVTTLTVTAVSSDPTIVPPGGFVFTGTLNSRTLVITPAEKREGLVTITLTISDSLVTGTQTFQLAVALRPDYEFIELPRPGPGQMVPQDINDAGQIVGYSRVGSTRRPLLWNVNATPTATVLRNDVNSIAVAINNSGDIAGSTETRGFVYRSGTFTTVGTTGASSSADDLNDSGAIVGETLTPDSSFFLNGSALTDFGGNFGVFGTYGGALRVNNRGDVCGVSPSGLAAILSQVTDTAAGTRTLRNLGALGALTSLSEPRINNAGQILINVDPGSASGHPVLYSYTAAHHIL